MKGCGIRRQKHERKRHGNAQKKPRLSVGAAMKRMEKLLLDSKKHLKVS
jgi:hypothetical protein